MLVVGRNLSELMHQHRMCHEESFDGDSLRLHLGRQIKRPKVGKRVHFTASDRSDAFTDEQLSTGSLILAPQDSVLACTRERIRMPAGYAGIVMPTSSSNRDFMSITLGANLASAGWEGRLTLEIYNQGPFTLEVPLGAHIGQLLVIRCSDASFSATSRYHGADGPAHVAPENR